MIVENRKEPLAPKGEQEGKDRKYSLQTRRVDMIV